MGRVGRYLGFLAAYAVGSVVSGGAIAYIAAGLFILAGVPLVAILYWIDPTLVKTVTEPGIPRQTIIYLMLAAGAALFAFSYALDKASPGLSKYIARLGLILICAVMTFSMGPTGVGR